MSAMSANQQRLKILPQSFFSTAGPRPRVEIQLQSNTGSLQTILSGFTFISCILQSALFHNYSALEIGTANLNRTKESAPVED